jgi:hypothetical protein
MIQLTRKDMDSTDRLNYRTLSFTLDLLPLDSAPFTYLRLLKKFTAHPTI